MNSPKDSKGRYERIPTPLKREAKEIRKSQQLLNLIERHKRFISWYQKKLGLSYYGLLWVVFFKGVAITLAIQYVLLIST